LTPLRRVEVLEVPPARILEGGTSRQNFLFLLKRKISRAQIRKAKENFAEVFQP
jgi:hypothetical protein